MYMLIASQSSPNRHTVGICIIVFSLVHLFPALWSLSKRQQILFSSPITLIPPPKINGLLLSCSKPSLSKLGLVHSHTCLWKWVKLICLWMKNLFSYEHWELNSVKNGKKIQWWLEGHSNQSWNLVFRLLGHASFTHTGCVYSTKQQKTSPFIIVDWGK